MNEINNLMKIGSVLVLLANKGYKTLSVTNEQILLADKKVSIEIAEIMSFNGWYYNQEIDSWIFDLSQLEE